MLGLKRGTVALYPHETVWEAEAAKTIERLKGILGDAAVDIQHVEVHRSPRSVPNPSWISPWRFQASLTSMRDSQNWKHRDFTAVHGTMTGKNSLPAEAIMMAQEIGRRISSTWFYTTVQSGTII